MLKDTAHIITVILFLTFIGCKEDLVSPPNDEVPESKIEIFTFSSDGNDINGKIFLPASFSKDKNLHSIFLIDFEEQHYEVATDEFAKVISAAEEIQGFEAVVVTLEEHLNIDASTGSFQEYYRVFKNMTSYVDENYSSNTSRTFIARGSEAGLVLMTLFLEDSASSVFDNFIATDSPTSFNSYIMKRINGDDFPKNKTNKKLHFSFSTSNNRSSCTNLINAIENAQYSWLKFESKEYTSKNYESAYKVSFAEGLKFVFSK